MTWPDDYLIPGVEPYYQEDAGIIYCGDCLEIMARLKGGSFDAVITDPPYGVGYKYTDVYIDTVENWKYLIDNFIPEAKRVSNVVITNCSTKQLWQYPQADGLLCWAHPGSPRLNTLGGFSEWEPILVYGKRRIYNDFKYLPYCSNMSYDASPHPCPKPVNLLKWLVSVGVDFGGIVLDPFLGSGTTAVAAKELGRRYIGIEIEEKYCEIAVRRLKQCNPLPFNDPQSKPINRQGRLIE